MSNDIFKVTDDILSDESIDPEDSCGCYIHAAILDKLECNKYDVIVGYHSIDIRDKTVLCSNKLVDWQRDDYSDKIRQPINVIWDEKQNLLYVEGEFDE